MSETLDGILRKLRGARVLFLCIHNSARSQMAEAFLNDMCLRRVRRGKRRNGARHTQPNRDCFDGRSRDRYLTETFCGQLCHR